MAALRQARAASGIITLETVVGQVKPTVLVGASTAHGAFTQQVIETMSAGVARPVIFPISNPTSQIEAMPADIIAWSKGRALVATGLSGKGLVMSVPRSVSGGRARPDRPLSGSRAAPAGGGSGGRRGQRLCWASPAWSATG